MRNLHSEHFSYSAWQWCFFVPALLAIAGAVLVLFGLKDTPASVGLPDPEEIDDNAPVKEVVTEPKEFTDFAYKRFVKEMVFKNPIVWILATSNFFIYIIRFTILDWGATFLTQDRGLSIQTASTVVGITEVLGIVGTLLAGWATDKFFGSKAHQTCPSASPARQPASSSGSPLRRYSWPVSGPDHHGQLLHLHAAGPYRNMPVRTRPRSVSPPPPTAWPASSATPAPRSPGRFSALADKFGWNSVFEVAIALGIVGVILFAIIWKARADGYAKADKLLEQVKADYEAQGK